MSGWPTVKCHDLELELILPTVSDRTNAIFTVQRALKYVRCATCQLGCQEQTPARGLRLL